MAIWQQVEASQDGEFDEWDKKPARVRFTKWLLEMDVTVSDPTGDPNSDLLFYVTAGPDQNMDQGPDVVRLWLREPYFQRTTRVEDDWLTEYPVNFWDDAAAVGCGHIEVPVILKDRVEALLTTREESTDTWIGQLQVNVKLDGCRLVGWQKP